MTDRYIVAEVSKNWRDGREVTPGSGLLAQQFERVVNVNAGRGYRLIAMTLHRLMTRPDELNETVIAVFERVGTTPGESAQPDQAENVSASELTSESASDGQMPKPDRRK